MKLFKRLAMLAFLLPGLSGCDDKEQNARTVEAQSFNPSMLERSQITGAQLAALVESMIDGREPHDPIERKRLVSHYLGIIASEKHATEGAFNEAVEILIARYELPS